MSITNVYAWDEGSLILAHLHPSPADEVQAEARNVPAVEIGGIVSSALASFDEAADLYSSVGCYSNVGLGYVSSSAHSFRTKEDS